MVYSLLWVMQGIYHQPQYAENHELSDKAGQARDLAVDEADKGTAVQSFSPWTKPLHASK